ncbi:MAG: hypothetical protein O3A00_12520, partial [Planctomycetota bacterium]|nr:hypothetical protein [Planctomycetota bacterium]
NLKDVNPTPESDKLELRRSAMLNLLLEAPWTRRSGSARAKVGLHHHLLRSHIHVAFEVASIQDSASTTLPTVEFWNLPALWPME